MCLVTCTALWLRLPTPKSWCCAHQLSRKLLFQIFLVRASVAKVCGVARGKEEEGERWCQLVGSRSQKLREAPVACCVIAPSARFPNDSLGLPMFFFNYVFFLTPGSSEPKYLLTTLIPSCTILLPTTKQNHDVYTYIRLSMLTLILTYTSDKTEDS